MIASVSCRNPFCAFLEACNSGIGRWGRATEEGRIRLAGCARSVGGKRVAISTMLQTLDHIERTLRCLGTRSRRSTFDTL